MKRMTQKDENGYYLKGDLGMPKKLYGHSVNRLAAYENTGIDPEEIEKIKLDLENAYMKSTARRYGIDVSRLRELAQADREGRCVVLPCKIGATVFMITRQSDDFLGEYPIIIQAQFRLSLLQKIGKTVFLTREEAEKALEGMKDG